MSLVKWSVYLKEWTTYLLEHISYGLLRYLALPLPAEFFLQRVELRFIFFLQALQL